MVDPHVCYHGKPQLKLILIIPSFRLQRFCFIRNRIICLRDSFFLNVFLVFVKNVKEANF